MRAGRWSDRQSRAEKERKGENVWGGSGTSLDETERSVCKANEGLREPDTCKDECAPELNMQLGSPHGVFSIFVSRSRIFLKALCFLQRQKRLERCLDEREEVSYNCGNGDGKDNDGEDEEGGEEGGP